jgi:3-deoxy-D-manno-octulosonate 8-phosphate phosphatase (KDO 8-P phosphatase)
VVILSEEELRVRASGIKLVLTDVDGVLTDATVLYSERGEELKRFSLRDGMGVERLRDGGIETALVTRERTGFAAARASKLCIAHVFVGVLDKRAHLGTIEKMTGVRAGEMAYIGDDENDVEIMRTVVEQGGLSAAPADAFDTARSAAVYTTRAGGGHGAFREFAEWILLLRREAAAARP